MLNLNVQRADVACSTHLHARPDREHSSHMTHGAADMSGQTHNAAMDPASCETPVQPDCCAGLIACSITLGLSDAHAVVAPLLRTHEAIAVTALLFPLSRLTGPEPPPPKA